MRTSQSLSLSLPIALVSILQHDATKAKRSVGEHIAAIVTDYLREAGLLPEEVQKDLDLLHHLRDQAIEKMESILAADGFSEDITLRVFQACKNDPAWLRSYEEYVQANPFQTGNPRKTNANQTIGNRIKSELGAHDLLDSNGKPARGRALGELIQTYQLLTRS